MIRKLLALQVLDISPRNTEFLLICVKLPTDLHYVHYFVKT